MPCIACARPLHPPLARRPLHTPSCADPEEPGSITAAGCERLCTELDIDIYSDPAVLVLAWQMGARTMGVFTESEWTAGMGFVGL